MKLHVIPDPLDTKTWELHEVNDLFLFLQERFPVLPQGTKFYYGSICPQNEVTPQNEKEVLKLQGMDEVYLVVDPCEPISLATIAMYAVVGLMSAYSLYTVLTMPKPPQQAQESPNNELLSRQNSMRPNGRIPDIFGQVRAYPDLIAETYTYYNADGVKVERSLLALGRGYYEIADVRDAQTDVQDLADTSISIYDPFTSIVGAPIYSKGRTFTELPRAVRKSKSITGQVLDAPNENRVESSAIYFTQDGYIKNNGGIDFTEDFTASDSVLISGATFGTVNAVFSGNVTLTTAKSIKFTTTEKLENLLFRSVLLNGALYNDGMVYKDFSGQYQVSSITETGAYSYEVFLVNASQVNPAWDSIIADVPVASSVQLNDNDNAFYLDGIYDIDSVTATEIKLTIVNAEWDKINGTTQGQAVDVALDKNLNKWVGWHVLQMQDADTIHFNIRFPSGLYRQNSKGGTSKDFTTARIEWQHVDDNGVPFGTLYTIDKRFDGQTRVPFGTTVNVDMPTNGSIRFRLCRTRLNIATNVVTEMRIEDVYLSAEFNKDSYDNVTIIQSEAVGNDGLYSIKERKLNCLVTRRLPLNGTGALTATKSGAQALICAALDDKIGRRTVNEVDIAQILNEEQEVIAYFGDEAGAEFSYTIDDSNLSFEEIAGMISSSMFCEPYRFGSLLRIKFEQPQDIPVLLFNHRNKTPRSDSKSRTFGVQNNFDGVEVEYTSPIDDARITYTASLATDPTNLKTIKTSGIRNEAQAKTRAWREWNKLYYKHITSEFDALEESDLLARNDKILVADNTLLATNDGEVEYVDGLRLELSQEVDRDSGYIFLQLPDASVDIISFVRESDYVVLLQRAPLIDLAIGRALYQIVEEQANATPFLVTEIRPQGKLVNKITAVNYDERFYEKDHTFFGAEING